MRTFPTLYKKTATGKVQTWSVSVRKNPDGSGTIVTEQGLLEGKHQVYEDTITEGKNLGKKNATDAYGQAVAEAEANWNKKLARNHYGEDISATDSAEKRLAAPMLAMVYEDHANKVDWTLAVAQPKLDGNRCTAKHDDDGITLWTRKGVQIATLPHIVDGLRGIIKKGETLDGELYVHGMHVTNLRSYLTRAQDGCENVSYRIYDMVTDQPFVERIDQLNSRIGDRVAEPRNGIALVETIRVMCESELREFQMECIGRGFEGAMLRWGDFGYESGKRSQGLLKCKCAQDAEFVILRVLPSEGTYNLEDASVHVARLECATADGHIFNTTAPGTIAEKHNILLHGDDYVGRRVTVKYYGYTATEEPVPFQPVAKEIL